MMPFERPTGPLPNTPADAGLSAQAAPDVQNGLGAAAHAAESSAQAAAAKVSAEAAALAGKATAAIGHAALAAVPAAGEPISPIIQLIMKMPGAMGMVHSFFEILQNLFSGENLIALFDPAMMQHALGSQVSLLHTLAADAGHFTVSLAHMPGDIMNGGGLHTMAGNLTRLDPGGFANNISAEHFVTDPANVGAPSDLGNAQFETGVGQMTSDGALAGPALTHGTQSNFLAGNQRLFSDKIGSGGNFNSVTSNTNVPTTANSIPSNSGATFGQEAANMSQPATQAVESTANTAANSGSSVLDKYGSNNVVASDIGTYKPSTTAYWGPGSTTDGGGIIEPMKAQQLSFKDMQAGIPKNVIDHVGHQAKGGFSHIGSSGSKGVMDGIGHQSISKAYSTSSFNGSHHISSIKPTHHVTHTAHHAAAAPQQHFEQPVVQQQPQAVDQTQIAQASDAQVAAPTDQTAAYTVQKGDNLWNIAEKQLGNGSRWTEIYKMNSDVIGQNPDLIFSGTELKLPGDAAMQQTVADVGKYVVKPGDNLWDIARHQLGDGTKWGDLYKANADVIGGNPRLILPGQELTMPGANEALAQAAPGAGQAVQSGMAQAMPTAATQMPVAQAPTMPADQMVAQQPMVQQQFAQQAPMMEQAPVQPNYGGAAYAGQAVQPVSQNVIQVQPQHELPVGPGAAGAAEMPANPADAIVSSGLAPDLSWIKKQ